MGNSASKKKSKAGGASVSRHTYPSGPLYSHSSSPSLSTTSSSSSSSFKVEPEDDEVVANCVPVGLYPECHWSLKAIRKMVQNQQIAPIVKGDSEVSDLTVDLDECPICMLVRFLPPPSSLFPLPSFRCPS